MASQTLAQMGYTDIFHLRQFHIISEPNIEGGGKIENRN